MKQRPRPLSKKLELATYAHDKTATFRVLGSSDDALSVQVPLPIMYRLYHLGRAYDLARIAGLHPTGSTAISFIDAQTLGLELDLLASFVNDPVLHHYLDQIENLIDHVRADTKRRIMFRGG